MNKFNLNFLLVSVATLMTCLTQVNAALKTYVSGGNWASATWSPAGAPTDVDDVAFTAATTANSSNLQNTSREVKDAELNRAGGFFIYSGVSSTPSSTSFTVRNLGTVAASGAFSFANRELGTDTGNLTVNVTGNLTLESTLNLGTISAATSSHNSSIQSFTVNGTTNLKANGIINVSRLATTSGTIGSVNFGALNMEGGILNLTTGNAEEGSDATIENMVTVNRLYGNSGAIRTDKTGGSLAALVIDGQVDGSYGGTIDNPNQGVVRLVKTGSSRQTLTGNNTYSGTTSITGGTLLLDGNGAINQSSSVNISGGTFAVASTSSVAFNRNVTLSSGAFQYSAGTNYVGNLAFTGGTIAGTNWNGSLGDLVIGTSQFISPGNSPGKATTTSQTWNAGGGYNWQIYDAIGAAGVGYDTVELSSILDLTHLGSDNRFNLNIWSLSAVDPDINGDALNFLSGGSYSWLIAKADTIAINIGTDVNDLFTVNLAAISGVTGGFTNANTGTWSVGLGGPGQNELYINYNAVPEPSTIFLAALFGCVCVIFRRIARRKACAITF